jgi:hypothetical protein
VSACKFPYPCIFKYQKAVQCQEATVNDDHFITYWSDRAAEHNTPTDLMEDSTVYFRSVMAGYLEEFPNATRLPPSTGSEYKDDFIKFCLEELTCIVSSLCSNLSNI